MKIRRDMKIKEVLEFDEEKMIKTLMWLAPEFERLRYPKLRRAMSGRVTVQQAARIARIPLTEMLYVLNLAAGEPCDSLTDELAFSGWEDYEYLNGDLPIRPLEISAVKETDPNVVFVDLMPLAEAKLDPMPAIAKGLVSMKHQDDVLIIKHPFDPIPLRDLFARRGYESWAEERNEGVWFIYFYRPRAAVGASAHPPVHHQVYLKAFAAAV